MAWAIEQQETVEPGSRHLLLCLCNYADQAGEAVFPSVDRLSRDTGMDRRSVQRQLRKLEKAILIVKGNAAITAAHIKRADRRPICYRIVMTGRHGVTPLLPRGGMGVGTGRHLEHERGGITPPDPSSDPSINRKSVKNAKSRAEVEAEIASRFGNSVVDLAQRKKVSQ